MALEELDEFFFDQRISLAVVTISGEEGETDILARSGIWPGDFCAPRILVKATCSAFQPEVEDFREEKEGCTRFALRIARSQAKAHHLEQQGMWDDFACHLLGAVVCEPERWRSPAVSCPHGAEHARNGQSGAVREQKTHRAPPRTRSGQKKRSRQKSLTLRRSGTRYTRKAKKTYGYAWE